MNMRYSADRRRSTLVATAGLAAMLLLAWLAIGQTRAYFSGTTSNTGNTLGTTSVTLDNNRATAMFDMSGMLPGSTETQTIEIDNPSAAPMGLRLYAADFFVDDDGDDLNGNGLSDIADYLDLEITIDSPDGEKTVFSGTLTAFAAATQYNDGWWSCADPDNCPHQPVFPTVSPTPTPTPTATPWVGLLESTLRAALPSSIEDDPALEDFWAAVQQADADTRAQQEATPQPTVPPTPSPTPPTQQDVLDAVSAAWDDVPDAIKDEIPQDQRDLIETLISGGTPGSMSAQSQGAPASTGSASPAGRGDRINAVNEQWSVRTYTFTVTMADDAGAAVNLEPDHRAGITFVWEGRA